jgi:hypothetical protein
MNAERVVVRCECGEQYYATTQYLGRSLRCSCGKILVVGQTARQPRTGSSEHKTTGKARGVASPALRSLALGVATICGVSLVADLGYQAVSLGRLSRQLDAERVARQQEHEHTVQQEMTGEARQVEAEERAHQARLRDEALISGALAGRNHEAEWARRQAHDPAIAKSAMEETLLRMEQVGRDPHLSAQAALTEVARLAAPPHSRIEVAPNGDGFEVKVAFLMSALSANENGAVTKHHDTASMRREIEALSAHVTKALFDYCGSRGIERLMVTCNHAMRRTIVPQNATPAERDELLRRAPVVLGRLYRVGLDGAQARSIADWRRISTAKVIGMMRVEFDDLKTLQISGFAMGPQQDPEGQLEF